MSDSTQTKWRFSDNSTVQWFRERGSVLLGSPTCYVVLLSLVLFAGFSIYTYIRYQTYHMTGSDFGSYIHMFSTTLSGKGWLIQGKYIASHPGGSYWGGHFSLTLLAFLPVFALFPSAATLVVIKSFILALSVVVLWFLSQNQLENERISLLLTLSYAFNPFLWNAWLFDFQEQILLPVFIFILYYGYANKRWVIFLVFTTLVVFTNEFVIILMIGFLGGLLIAAYRRGELRNRLPELTVAAGIVVSARLISSYIISYYSTMSGIPPNSIAAPLHPFTEGTRASIGGLVEIILSHPKLLLETVSVGFSEKLIFLIALLLPVLFVSLGDESAIGAVTPFIGFAWVFAGREAYYTFDAHYPLYLLPFLYIGAIQVLRKVNFQSLRDRMFPISSDGIGSHLTPNLYQLLVVVVALNIIGSGVVIADKNDPLATPDQKNDLRGEAFGMIPENSTMVTQNDLFPHVATRPNATYIPNMGTFKSYREEYGTPRPEYIVYDTESPWSNIILKAYGNLLNGEYNVYAQQEGIWIWKQGYSGPHQGITQQKNQLGYNLNQLILMNGEKRNGNIVGESIPANQTIWYGPYTQLPPETYTVTYHINVTDTRSDTQSVLLDVVAGKDHHTIERRRINETDGVEKVEMTFSLNGVNKLIEFRGFSKSAGGRTVVKNMSVELHK